MATSPCMFASISMAVRTKMPRGFRLDWKGDQIKDRLLNAARQGIEETMAACVVDAKHNVPVATGTLQGSIQYEPPRIERNKAIGLWGSFDVVYAASVETGIRPKVRKRRRGIKRAAKGQGVRRVETRKNKGRKNFLRGAADKEYPKLAGNIRRRFGRS